MLCDVCHENEAVINFTEITSEGRRDIHLCQSCAAKETAGAHPFISLADPSFLANLLSSVLGKKEPDEEISEDNIGKTNIVCPSCSTNYNEFLKNGKFGCAECYRTFSFLLDGYLKKIQGNTEHIGKSPVYSGETIHISDVVNDHQTETEPGRDKISFTVDQDSSEEELKNALKRAVAREEYEEAARIRDMIRAGRGVLKHE